MLIRVLDRGISDNKNAVKIRKTMLTM